MQLTSSCNCVTCDSKQEAESEVLSIALGHDDLSEYCTVWTIKETLINLLKIRLPGVSDEDLQCTLNFEEREQILDIGRQVRALDYNPESCTLPGDYPTHVCRTQSHFALFQELPALLRNETDSEGLADELETMIPYINSTLQDQLEVSAWQYKRQEGVNITCCLKRLARQVFVCGVIIKAPKQPVLGE